MIHRYNADGQMVESGAYHDVPGAGRHPSAAWLAARGWHEVEPTPPAPAAGAVWVPGNPAYELIDGMSVPQGEWASADAMLLDEVLAAIAANPDIATAAARFFGALTALEDRGVIFAGNLTFYAAVTAIEMSSDEIDAALEGLKLRILYDDLVFHCGDMQTAYKYLPVLPGVLAGMLGELAP
jgi:hypothetical protein